MEVKLDELLHEINNRILLKTLQEGFKVAVPEIKTLQEVIDSVARESIRKMRNKINQKENKERYEAAVAPEDRARHAAWRKERQALAKEKDRIILDAARKAGLIK